MFRPGQLQRVWLHSVSFEENSAYKSDDRELFRYRVDSKMEVADFHRSEKFDETHAAIDVSAEVLWLLDGTVVDDEAPFSLAITLSSLFVWPDQVTDESIARKWLEYNGLYLTWPYLRSHISTITGMSRLPGLMIYTMNVPDAPDFDSEENVLEESVGKPEGAEPS